MILVAHTLSLAQSGVNFAIVIAGGAGQHIEHVQDKLPTFNRVIQSRAGDELLDRFDANPTQLMVAVMALYNAAQIATKISLLIQYCTIFPGRSMRLISQWGIGLLLLWGIAQQ